MRAGRSIIILALVAAAVGLFHALLQEGHVRVCYELQAAEATNTGLYWDTGDGFSEARRVVRPVSGGSSLSEVCLTSRSMPARGLLRLDPVDDPGSFKLSNVKVIPLAPVLPRLFEQDVSSVAPLKLNQVVEQEDGYRALANDPYLIWRYDARLSSVVLYPFNAGLLFLAALLAAMTYRVLVRDKRSSGVPVSVVSVFGFYFFYVLIGWLGLPFNDILVYSHWALGWSVILMFIVLSGYAVGKLSWQAAPCGAALSMIAMVCGVDAAYRFGATDGQPFVRVSHDSYHWRLSRPWDENFRHSSIKYHHDFQLAKPLLQKGAYFISGRATGYYVAAALPLYPRVTHPHHSRMSKKRDPDFLAALCDEEGGAEAGRLLTEVREDVGSSGPLYLILVKDPENRNIRSQCTSRDPEIVKRNLVGLGELLYSGEFVTIYRLARSPDPDGISREDV